MRVGRVTRGYPANFFPHATQSICQHLNGLQPLWLSKIALRYQITAVERLLSKIALRYQITAQAARQLLQNLLSKIALRYQITAPFAVYWRR